MSGGAVGPVGAVPFRVDRDEARSFLAATGSGDPRPSDAVPPFLVAARSLRAGLEQLLPFTAVGGPAAVVHVRHDVRWRQAVALGAELVVRAELTRPRLTDLGTMVTAVVATDAGGAPAVVQRAELLLGGTTVGERGGRADPRPAPPRRRGTAPIATATVDVDADQAVRYGAAAGDPNPIHVDPEAARAAGLDGVVLHGMCTLALVGQVVVTVAAGGDMSRLARLSARFAAPVRPGTRLAVDVWDAGGDGDETHVAVDVRNGVGSRALRHAVASLARG